MPKKKLSVKEELDNMFGELGELTDDTIEGWNKYWDKGVKKGAKDARRLCNEIRKKGAEIRRKFKELEI